MSSSFTQDDLRFLQEPFLQEQYARLWPILVLQSPCSHPPQARGCQLGSPMEQQAAAMATMGPPLYWPVEITYCW